jgi:hypothetical protein
MLDELVHQIIMADARHTVGLVAAMRVKSILARDNALAARGDASSDSGIAALGAA